MNVQVEPRTRANWGRIILGAVLLLMAYALLQVAPVLWGEIKKVLPRETRVVQTGPSAAWADMWALAKQEATKVNKDAIVNWYPDITAMPATKWKDFRQGDQFEWAYDGAVELTFGFESPKGPIDVSMQDAARQATLVVNSHDSSDPLMGAYVRSFADNHTTEALVNQIKVAPREALSSTRAEFEKYKGAGAFQHLEFGPRMRLCSYYTGTPYWLVWYDQRVQGNVSASLPSLYFLVDAVNGTARQGTCSDVEKDQQP